MATPQPLNPTPMSREAYYERYRNTSAHVELIDGQVYEMPPPGPRHSTTVVRLYRSLVGQLDADAYVVRPEQPITLPGDSDPEPDIVIARGPDTRYVDGHPGASDVLLAVEICDSTQGHDYGKKVPLYARHGIPEYWIVNLKDKWIDVYRYPDPETGDYGEHFISTASTLQPRDQLAHMRVHREDLFVD